MRMLIDGNAGPLRCLVELGKVDLLPCFAEACEAGVCGLSADLVRLLLIWPAFWLIALGAAARGGEVEVA